MHVVAVMKQPLDMLSRHASKCNTLNKKKKYIQKFNPFLCHRSILVSKQISLMRVNLFTGLLLMK